MFLRGAIILLLGISTVAYGTSFVITDGEIVTTAQTLANVGDEGLIDAGGVLNFSTASTNAITMGNSNQFVENNGLVMTTGSTSLAIYNTGSNPIVVNNGSILTTNFDAIVFLNNGGTTCQFTNNGSISTVGVGAVGMESSSGIAIFTNNGVLSTIGTTTPAILSEGSNSILTNNGVVTTGGSSSPGLNNINGSNVIMTNTGSITLAGTGSIGIYSYNQSTLTNNVEIFNSGSITTVASGIVLCGNGGEIYNSGSITTSGSTAYGIQQNAGTGIYIQNSGTIKTTGSGSIAIDAPQGNSVVLNEGVLVTTNSSAHAIEISGASAEATNVGLISTAGSSSDGILSNTASAAITNFGTILASGSGSSAIASSGNSVQLINGGTLYSAQSNALSFTGTSPTLSLLLGSNIQGAVSTTSPLALSVENGLNLLLTVTGGGGFGTLGISDPYVKVGNTIAVIDPTGFALQADLLADLSDTLLDDIYRHRWALFNCCPYKLSFWAEGLGSWRERDYAIAYRDWQYGFLAGVECYYPLGCFSAVGGASYATARVAQDTQSTHFNSYFGGVTYQQILYGTFIGISAIVGQVNYQNDRTVMNNLAPGGAQVAVVETTGKIATGEVSLGRNLFDTAFYRVRATLTARYAGLFLGDYNENGSGANLTVQSRNIDLFTARGEVSFPLSNPCLPCCWVLEPYVGYAGRFQTRGSQVNTILLGEILTFNPGSPRQLGELLVGLRASQMLRCLNVFFNVEGTFDSERSNRVLGEGGFNLCF